MMDEFYTLSDDWSLEECEAMYNRYRAFEVHENFTQAISVDTFLTVASQLLSWLNLEGLSEKEIRDAGSKLSYIRSVGAITRDSVAAIKTFVSFLARVFFGMDPFDPIFQTYSSSLVVFIEQTEPYLNTPDDAIRDRASCEKMLDLNDFGNKLARNPILASAPTALAQRFSVCLKFINDQARKSMAHLFKGGDRVEPLCIFFTGESGTGKSSGLDDLKAEIIKEEYDYYSKNQHAYDVPPPRDYDSLMSFHYNPLDKYQDGFIEKKFFEHDEGFQSRETSEVEGVFLIRAVNSAPFPLNASAIEDKGRLFFNCDYYFLTSNIANKGLAYTSFNDIGIRDPSAIKRRIHVAIHAEEPLVGSVGRKLFTLQKCQMHVNDTSMDQFVGKKFYLCELARILAAMKRKQMETFKSKRKSYEQLRDNQMHVHHMRVKEIFKSCPEFDIFCLMLGRDLSKFIENKNGVEMYDYPKMVAHLTNYNSDHLIREREYEDEYLEILAELGHPSHIIYEDYDKMKVLFVPELSLKYKSSLVLTAANQRIKDDNLWQTMDEPVLPHTKEYEDLAKSQSWMGTLKTILKLQIFPWTKNENVDVIMKIMAFAAVLMSGYVIWKIIEALKSSELQDSLNDLVDTHSPSGIKSTGRPRRKRQNHADKFKDMRVDKIVPHSTSFEIHSADKNFMDCMQSKMFKTVLRVFLYAHRNPDRSDAGSSGVAVGWHIKDGWVMTNSHLFAKATQQTLVGNEFYFSIMLIGENYEAQFELTDELLVNKSDDIALFRIPKGTNIPPGAYKYLPSIDDGLNVPQGTQMYRVTASDEGGVFYTPVTKRYDDYESKDYAENTTKYILTNAISYYGFCTRGDSGSPIILPGKQGKLFLVAMHCGGFNQGDKRVGIATSLNREYIDALLGSSSETVDDLVQTESSEFPLIVDAIVPAEESCFMCRINPIKPSKLYDFFLPHDMAPAELLPKGDYDPLTVAWKKIQQKEWPAVPFNKIRVNAWLKYMYDVEGVDKRVYDWDIVLNGIDGKVKGICSGTSCGYPWNLRNSQGKLKYMHRDADNRLRLEPSFEKLLNEQVSSLEKGYQVKYVFMDQLKPEVLRLEKVKRPRLFAVAPLDLTLVFRRYFLAFVTYVQSQCAEKFCSVGITTSSCEWTLLYHRISRFDKSIIAGDFSNYDGNVPGYIGEMFINYVNHWYDDGSVNAHVRMLLFTHIRKATRIYQNKLYHMEEGNPSGNPITSIYNSFVNAIMIFIILTEDFKISSNSFDILAYGDDNVIAIDVEGIHCNDLTPFFKSRFNMDFTHYSKSEFTGVDTPKTINYLKRRWVKYGNIYLSPLEHIAINNMLKWISRGVLEKEWLCSTIESYILEAFQHGEEMYIQYTQHMRKAVLTVFPEMEDFLRVRIRSWHEIFHDIYVQDSIIVSGRRIEPSEVSMIRTRVKNSKLLHGLNVRDDLSSSDCTDGPFETHSIFSKPELKMPEHPLILATLQEHEVLERATDHILGLGMHIVFFMIFGRDPTSFDLSTNDIKLMINFLSRRKDINKDIRKRMVGYFGHEIDFRTVFLRMLFGLLYPIPEFDLIQDLRNALSTGSFPDYSTVVESVSGLIGDHRDRPPRKKKKFLRISENLGLIAHDRKFYHIKEGEEDLHGLTPWSL